MTFDEELTILIDKARMAGSPQEAIEAIVAAFFRRHGREPPPPIVGTIALTEPDDSLK
jgi:hypothetical protein